MIYLLIDQGNSALKWCLSKDDDFMPMFSGGLDELDHFLQQNDKKINKVLVSSVRREKSFNTVQSLLDKYIALDIEFARTDKRQGTLINSYVDHKQMGVDRWLAMIAGQRLVKQGFMVVDAGSALTVDIVDGSGQHLGGHIIPGLSMQKNQLLCGTERVTFQNNLSAQAYKPGLSTSEAVHNGCLTNICAYIDSMLTHSESLDIQQMILTGGDADVISTNIETKHQLIPNLVLQGLYYSFFDQ